MKRVTIVSVDELISFAKNQLKYENAEQILNKNWIIPEGIEIRDIDYDKSFFDSQNWSDEALQIMNGFCDYNKIEKFRLTLDD